MKSAGDRRPPMGEVSTGLHALAELMRTVPRVQLAIHVEKPGASMGERVFRRTVAGRAREFLLRLGVDPARLGIMTSSQEEEPDGRSER